MEWEKAFHLGVKWWGVINEAEKQWERILDEGTFVKSWKCEITWIVLQSIRVQHCRILMFQMQIGGCYKDGNMGDMEEYLYSYN